MIVRMLLRPHVFRRGFSQKFDQRHVINETFRTKDDIDQKIQSMKEREKNSRVRSFVPICNRFTKLADFHGTDNFFSEFGKLFLLHQGY